MSVNIVKILTGYLIRLCLFKKWIYYMVLKEVPLKIYKSPPPMFIVKLPKCLEQLS